MPITPFLGDQTFDCETKRIMDVAFEMAHAVVERDWGDHSDAIIAKRIDAIIAKRIMELATAGERNPDVLCEQALDSLRSQRI